MFTRHFGNGVGHQCQHPTHIINDTDQGEDISYDDDHSDDGGNCADEDEDADGNNSDELEDVEEDNTEEEDEFSDEDDTGYDDL
jgi:ribonuclease E